MTRRLMILAPLAATAAQDEAISVQHRRTPNNGLAVIVDGPSRWTAFRVEVTTQSRGRLPFPGPRLSATIGRCEGETAIASLAIPEGYSPTKLLVVGLVDDLALPVETIAG